MIKLSNGMALWEMKAVLQGKDLAVVRSEVELGLRIHAESEKYLMAPVSKWPNIVLNWDTSKDSQRFSLDGYSLDATSLAEFHKFYPHGFCLGRVVLEEFDKQLCGWTRREGEELWTVGMATKLACLIVYLSEGRPISPPFAKPLPSKEIILGGGNHRYAIAKAIGEVEIPIHVLPEDKEQIESLVSVTWTENDQASD